MQQSLVLSRQFTKKGAPWSEFKLTEKTKEAVASTKEQLCFGQAGGGRMRVRSPVVLPSDRAPIPALDVP